MTQQNTETLIYACENCDWKGPNPLPFNSSWSDWINCQDLSNPVILPAGECPNEDCMCSVYLVEALEALALSQKAHELLQAAEVSLAGMRNAGIGFNEQRLQAAVDQAKGG